jgi:DNA-binding transcriptional MerR regulator
MGLQQLGFNFFDETPPVEVKPPAQPPAPEPLLKNTEPASLPEPNEESELNNLISSPELPMLVEISPVDIAFVVEEEASPLALIEAPRQSIAAGKKNTRGRMKLSDMDLVVDLVEVPDDELLFQKRYYSIGAVSDMFKVNVSLIRFWENEFDILKPKKNGKGDRLFRPEDIKSLQLIYHLLREKKYTIEGARDFLKKNKKNSETLVVIESLKKTKAFLLQLKASL